MSKCLNFVISAAAILVSTSEAMAQDNRGGARADALNTYGFQPSSAQQLRSDGRRHSPNPAYDVYDVAGRYIGSDPDIAIRGALQRDPLGAGR